MHASSITLLAVLALAAPVFSATSIIHAPVPVVPATEANPNLGATTTVAAVSSTTVTSVRATTTPSPTIVMGPGPVIIGGTASPATVGATAISYVSSSAASSATGAASKPVDNAAGNVKGSVAVVAVAVVFALAGQ
ncbi:hypothetical protein HKX48_009118 [Thoreauomyces humboldtii]|nr:hypothetical protein HKX48_009118 [Thoreauomyces humboldtii]